jgi:hypothetical protein
LLDFIALDQLSKIYLNSVSDTHEKLKDLSADVIDFDLMPKEEAGDSPEMPAAAKNKRQQTASVMAQGGVIPFFSITARFIVDTVPRKNFYEEYIDGFTPAAL